jgi:16S rRNA (guanine(1405)-N(7))-methyltransferase
MPLNQVDPLAQTLDLISRSKGYDQIHPALVRRIAAQELEKRKNVREAARHTKAKLHQIAGAFIAEPIDFLKWKEELLQISNSSHPSALKEYCTRMMEVHISTRERLPYLEAFYAWVFEGAGTIQSILDLGCGLNPLSIPWMPLAPGGIYHACDIFLDLVEFNQYFLQQIKVEGTSFACDLSQESIFPPVDLALLLKTLPLIEQIDKKSALPLLERIPADNLIVSFPTRSIGGKSKGMASYYRDHFNKLIAQKKWQVSDYQFPNELVFRIHKNLPADIEPFSPNKNK